MHAFKRVQFCSVSRVNEPFDWVRVVLQPINQLGRRHCAALVHMHPQTTQNSGDDVVADEAAQRLQDALSVLSNAIFNERDFSRTDLQLTVIVVEDGGRSYRSRSNFARLIADRTITPSGAPKVVTEKTVGNGLYEMGRQGYLRTEKRPTPEAGGKTLTHFQIVALADKVMRAAEIVWFQEGRARKEVPATAGTLSSKYPPGRADAVKMYPPQQADSTPHGQDSGQSTRCGGPSTFSSSSKKKKFSREGAAKTSIADALCASGHLIETVDGWQPSRSFHEALMKSYPDVDHIAVVEKVVGNVLQYPRAQTTATVIQRIRGECAAMMLAKRSNRPVSARSPISSDVATGAAQYRVFSHAGEQIRINQQDWHRLTTEYELATNSEERNAVFARFRGLHVPEAAQ